MKLSDKYDVDCELEVQLTVNCRVNAECMPQEWFDISPDGKLTLTQEGIDWFIREAKDQANYGFNDHDIVDYEIPSLEDAEWTVFNEDAREVSTNEIPLGDLEPF